MTTLTTTATYAPAPAPPVTARAADGLASVPQAEWDALVPDGSRPLSHGYLSAWEHVELRGLRSCPVLAYRDGAPSPLAACPGYFYDLDIPTVRSPGTGAVVRAIRRLLPDFLYARTYELGSPTPLTNPFLVADPAGHAAAVRALIEAGIEHAERGHAEFTLVQNFTSRETPAGRELARLGFAGVPIPPTAVLDLPYGSFDEYLGAMRAQYRRRAQQTLKHSSHLDAEHLTEFSGLAEELARLWSSIYERAKEVKREVLTPSFFREASSLQESSALLMRREDGSIASFALLLEDRPWLSFLQCGFEVDAGRHERAYFRLLYEIVRFALERGFEQVDLGMTTLEPKLDVGAVPIPLFAWLKHRNPLFQRIILALGRGPLKPPELEPRRVFKEPARGAAELVARRRLSS